jgi:predicted 3-demethylubiquinone-9 3-methyltransferase (glyoxalase superfamily)
MQKIVPNLWFDKNAEEAAVFYTSIFSNSKINAVSHYGEAASKVAGLPEGSVLTVDFEIEGHQFTALNGGPIFKFTPAVSFMINFDPSREANARERIDVVWNKLVEGGKVLMELGTYPFSERYGWLIDKYGLSWQLIYTDPEGDVRPAVIPCLLFVGEKCGKAAEAIDFYSGVFKDAKKGDVVPYPAGMEPDKEGTVMFGEFKLFETWFAAMDSAREHGFDFTEANSFLVNCETQEEVDYYWEKLSAVPESEQCGWLKDKYGVSWQIVPTILGKLMTDPDPAKVERTMAAMLQMHKLDIAGLKDAAEAQ